VAGTPTPAAPAETPPKEPLSTGEKPAITPAPKPEEADPTKAAAPAPEVPEHLAKAPGTWTPAAREHWKDVPIQVREEVAKREREMTRALSFTTEARRLASEFQQTMQPYLGFIAAENSTPMQAVNNMMQSAALLRVGTPAQKVGLVADIIRNFGVDLGMLDNHLAGTQQAQDDPRTLVQREIQAALAPYRQQQQAQVQQVDTQVNQELQEFASKNEFYNDVADTMADLIEVARKRGGVLGLQTAYDRAILLHEPVRQVIEARNATKSNQQQAQIAATAKAAAVSVAPSSEAQRTAPVVGDDIRSAIEASMTRLQGR
jgi:hypothetical protein